MLVWLAFGTTALAAGFFTPDTGVRALGRGGAATAGVDDLTAQYWNPAALAHLDGPQVTVDLAAVDGTAQFTRVDGDTTLATSRSRFAPMPVPTLAAGTVWHHVDLAMGVFSPTGPRWSWPKDGPQRYGLITETTTEATLGASAAKSFGILSIGVTIGIAAFSLDETLAATNAIGNVPDDANFDIGVGLHAKALAPTGNLGILFTPIHAFAFGASVEPPIVFHATGSLANDVSGNAYFTGAEGKQMFFTQASVTDDGVKVDVAMPLVVRAGALARIAATELELDGVFERWSPLRSITVTNVDLVVPTTGSPITTTADVKLPVRLQDAGSVRFGACFPIHGAIIGRAGAFFETSAADDTARGVGVPDGNKVGVSAGTSVPVSPSLTFDAAIAGAIIPGAMLDRSSIFQIALGESLGAGTVGFGKTVGNGRFAAQIVTAGVGIQWKPRRKHS